MMCPSCRQYDGIWLSHGELDDDGEEVTHAYCRNCDYGLCDQC